MGKRFVVKHDKDTCIGCGACAAVAPEYFEMEDGTAKAHLKDSDIDDRNVEVLEIDEDGVEKCRKAEAGCPVNCISVEEK